MGAAAVCAMGFASITEVISMALVVARPGGVFRRTLSGRLLRDARAASRGQEMVTLTQFKHYRISRTICQSINNTATSTVPTATA